jgi:hypothetical protein
MDGLLGGVQGRARSARYLYGSNANPGLERRPIDPERDKDFVVKPNSANR